ncbi:MAG: helix-turn-helix transcriptional regulator [Deltaproteobacteria bacterium]|nr:helix-turn-helix transcriptional regulator [Deltaproteobacteria bacterium]
MKQLSAWKNRALSMGCSLDFIFHRAGISRQTISNWKRGITSPRGKNLDSVEDAFIKIESRYFLRKFKAGQ